MQLQRQTNETASEMLFHSLVWFQIIAVSLTFSSTKVRRRDQSVNFQVKKIEFQDKSMTLENGDADETEQKPLSLVEKI